SAGIAIEHIAKAHIRKEEVVAKVLERRGDHPGLVHVISAMEACDSYRPWHDKTSGQTFLKPDGGKCLHYYFYFIDDEVGLCYCACRPGVPSGCSSIVTDTAGWRGSLPPPASALPLPT